jgi:1,6-anhydro-N-acetylmuramate kinase
MKVLGIMSGTSMDGIDLDSDVLPDELLEKLLNHLKREALLEK